MDKKCSQLRAEENDSANTKKEQKSINVETRDV